MSMIFGGGGSGGGGGVAVASTDHSINISNFAVPSITPPDDVFGAWVADHDLTIKSINIFLMAPPFGNTLELRFTLDAVVEAPNLVVAIGAKRTCIGF